MICEITHWTTWEDRSDGHISNGDRLMIGKDPEGLFFVGFFKSGSPLGKLISFFPLHTLEQARAWAIEWWNDPQLEPALKDIGQ